MQAMISFLLVLPLVVTGTQDRALYSLSRKTSAAAIETVKERADAIARGDEKLSYDGNLQDIFALAQALADEDGLTMPITSPSMAPANDSDATLKSCTKNFNYEQVEEVSFTYSIENSPSYSSSAVQSSLEYAINDALAAKFLNCGARLRRLILATDAIVITAVDSLPVDTPIKDMTCTSTVNAANTCTIVNGIMDVYVGTKADSALISYTIRSSVRDFFPVAEVEGLVKAIYLAPDLDTTSQVNTGAGGASLGAASGSSNNLSTRSIVLFSFAAVAVLSSMGAALWFKKIQRSRNDHQEFESTVAPDLSLLGGSGSGPDMTPIRVETPCEHKDFLADTDSDSLSPYNSMLPTAYRLNQTGAQMDVLLEFNESYDDQDSHILISEGWTTDSEVDSEEVDLMIDTSRTKDIAVLGARKRKDEVGGSLLPPLETMV